MLTLNKDNPPSLSFPFPLPIMSKLRQHSITTSPLVISSPTFSAPIRSLTISNPQQSSTILSNLRGNVILVTKYDFVAEGENEISVNKGDLVKLIDRLGNGWVLVKYIDRVQPPGLIPASYVDIAVNDQTNPITLTWLQKDDDDSEQQPTSQAHIDNIIDELNYLDLQFNKVESKFVTINNRPYPIQASISNFLLFNGRIWYRLDIEYSNKSKSYICRYYQDFYNLHIKLLDLYEILSKIEARNSVANSGGGGGSRGDTIKLPKLPEPIPTQNNDDENKEISMLLKRCNELNIYINKLILNKYYQTSDQLRDWLEVRDLPGFIINSFDNEDEKDEQIDKMTNDEINEKILPGSINIVKNYYEKLEELEELEKQKQVQQLKDSKLPQRSQSKNIYNNYQQAAHAMAGHTNSIKHKMVMSKTGTIRHIPVGSRSASVSVSGSGSGTSPAGGSKSHLYQSDRSSSTKGAAPVTRNNTTIVIKSNNHSSSSNNNNNNNNKNSTGSNGSENLSSTSPTSLTSASTTASSSSPTPSPSITKKVGETPVDTNDILSSPILQQQKSMPSINATPKSTFQSSPGSPLIGPSLPPSTLSPLFNPQSPKLVNNNLNSPKMDYSPKPGFTPRIKPPTPTTPATSKFQPVSNTITTTTISVATTDFSTSSPKMSPMGGHFNANFPAYSQTNNTNNSNSTSNSNNDNNTGSKHQRTFSNQFIKCKIIDPKNDIIVIKLNKGELKLINDLKIALKSRININFPPVPQPQPPQPESPNLNFGTNNLMKNKYNQVFIKLPNLNNFENIDTIKFNFHEFLRFNDKMYLKIEEIK